MQRTTPLSAAFSTTAFGLLFLIAGAFGYEIKMSNWSFVAGEWASGPVWWEIWFGIISLVLAVYFWRKGLRSLP